VRRGSFLIAAVLLLAIAGGFVAAIFSERRIAGSVPGEAPVLSMAAQRWGIFVGTADGLWVSPDGERWAEHPSLGRGPVQVASIGEKVLALSGKAIYELEDLQTEAIAYRIPNAATAVGGTQESIYVATSAGLLRVSPEERYLDGEGPDPKEILALAGAGIDSSTTIFAGSVSSGLWRSDDEGMTWVHVLATPATAILVDPLTPGRILLGTPGGLLLSSDNGLSWRFTELREPVTGLSAAAGGSFFAVAHRLVYSSPDGDRGWEALVLKS
jgi:hypothetical protein